MESWPLARTDKDSIFIHRLLPNKKVLKLILLNRHYVETKGRIRWETQIDKKRSLD